MSDVCAIGLRGGLSNKNLVYKEKEEYKPYTVGTAAYAWNPHLTSLF